MSAALVQEKIGILGGNVSFDVAMTVGNLIVVNLMATTGSITAISSSGVTGGFTKREGLPMDVGVGELSVWYGIVDVASIVIVTVTVFRGSVGRRNMQEYSGCTSTPVDVSSNNAGTSSNPATSSITPSQADLIVACSGNLIGTYSSGPTNGFTRLTQSSDTTNILESAYKVGETGAITTDWTMTGSVTWAAIAVGFKEVLGGFVPTSHYYRSLSTR